MDFLRFYASSDSYEDLYNHYAPGLAENGIHVEKVEKHEALVTVDKKVEAVEKKVKEKVEEPKKEKKGYPCNRKGKKGEKPKRGRPSKSSPSK